MTIKPLADKVVVKKLQAEETTKSGIILSSGAQQKPQIAEIIAVGPGGVVDGNEIKREEYFPSHYPVRNAEIHVGVLGADGKVYPMDPKTGAVNAPPEAITSWIKGSTCSGSSGTVIPVHQIRTTAAIKARTKFITGPIRITNIRFQTLWFPKFLGSSFDFPVASSSP